MSEFFRRELPNGRVAAVMLRTYGKAQLVLIGEHNQMFVEHGWGFESPGAAVVALLLWDGTGEPTGWYRDPYTGRRRPDGDPALEYFAPGAPKVDVDLDPDPADDGLR